MSRRQRKSKAGRGQEEEHEEDEGEREDQVLPFVHACIVKIPIKMINRWQSKSKKKAVGSRRPGSLYYIAVSSVTCLRAPCINGK